MSKHIHIHVGKKAKDADPKDIQELKNWVDGMESRVSSMKRYLSREDWLQLAAACRNMVRDAQGMEKDVNFVAKQK